MQVGIRRAPTEPKPPLDASCSFGMSSHRHPASALAPVFTCRLGLSTGNGDQLLEGRRGRQGDLCLANSYYLCKSPSFHRLINTGGNGTIGCCTVRLQLDLQVWPDKHLPRSHRRRGAAYVVVAATVGATAVFLVARTAINDVLRVKAEPVPHKRR